MLKEFNTIFIEFKEGFYYLLPKIIIALVVLIIGYLIAKLIRFLIKRFVAQVSNLTGSRFRNISFNEYATLIGTTFFWIILLITFLLAAEILGLSPVTNWVGNILRHTPNLIAAILIVLAAIVFGKFLSDLISSAGRRLGLPYLVTLGKVAQYFLLITAIIIAIDQIGIEITFLTTLINIMLAAVLFGAALAFGIGAKTSVSNILANFYIRKIYKEGDHLKIGNLEGTVIRIDSTMIVLENEEEQIFIPAKTFSETSSILKKKN